ncbi:MAG: FecCD family ABC transporter permease [Halothiobacillaceae bacterium]
MLLATGSLLWGSSGPVWPFGTGAGVEQAILMELRLPRTLAALAAGGLLGLAGALVQVLTRNPLADPYILGISSGAAVGALVAILLGATALFQNMAAALGAGAAMLLVLGLSRGTSADGGHRLLLTGVVLAAALGAVITLLLSLAPDLQLRGMLFWLMGDLSGATQPGIALAGLLVLTLLVLPFATALNLLTRGPMSAAALGVEVGKLRLGAYLVAAGATALAVLTAGTIGFVGLLAPHLARLLVGSDHRLALPGALLVGAMLVSAADLLARTVIAPQQLPAGAILALIGAPLFLYLLNRGRRP